MKKFFALMTIAGMLFFVGCGPAKQEPAEEIETTEEVVTETEEVVEETEEKAEEVIN